MTIDILYIAGFGRSGSTLIESALQRNFDALGLGELFFIWDRGVLKDELVGSGVRFSQSAFWSDVLDEGFGGVSRAQAIEYNRIFQSARGEKLKRGSLKGQIPENITEFRDVAEPLYRALLKVSGSRVLLDSSKYPLFAATISEVLDCKIGVLHAYRDPRAVAFSWSQKKRRAEGAGGQEFMSRSKTPLSSIWRWQWFNHQARQLGRECGLPYVSIGYENFCANPDQYIQLIGQSFDLGPKVLEDLEWQSVSGNPARFEGKLEKIVIDEKWRRAMPGYARALVGATCQPQYERLQTQDAAQFTGGAR